MLCTAEFTLTLCRFASKSCSEKYLRTFILFLRFWRKNKMNVHKIFSKYDFDAKRQRVSVNPAVRNISNDVAATSVAEACSATKVAAKTC
jgi:hypothetical protein